MRPSYRTVFVAIVAAVAGLAAGAAGEKKAPDKSPHAEAIELVLRTRADDIRNAEGVGSAIRPGEEPWWFDTKERTWVVKRPFSPGTIDSTHLFEVTYRIDGKDVAAWLVDTRKGTANRRVEAKK